MSIKHNNDLYGYDTKLEWAYATLHIYDYYIIIYYYSTRSDIYIVCFNPLEHTTNMKAL